MKQKPTLFGQAFQISELRQQIAGLEEQNKKLATEVKILRESDRALFDAQEAMIDGLKSLVKDWQSWATLNFVVETSTYVSDTPWRARFRELNEQTQALLAEKEQ